MIEWTEDHFGLGLTYIDQPFTEICVKTSFTFLFLMSLTVDLLVSKLLNDSHL